MKKNVALALSSGGPRGFAYIGAIEELVERGYNITSIAGTSIGSLIGGVYACGALPQFKEWLYSLDAWKVFTLMDLSISKNHFVKGDRIISAMKEVVPDINIEDLPIPYCTIATDLYTGQEVVFNTGKLFDAIRASISIPSLFRPVKYGLTTLIDGGIANCLPMSRVARNGEDILVAFDVNYVDVDEIRQILLREHNARQKDESFEIQKRTEMRELIAHVKSTEDTLLTRLKYAGSKSISLLKDVISYRKAFDEDAALDYEDNYYDILDRTFNLMNHHNTELAIQIHQPDVLVRMPFDAYGAISDYAKASEIAEIGRQLMSDALNKYESAYADSLSI